MVLLLGVCAVSAEETPAYSRLKKIAAEMAEFGMPVDIKRVRLTVTKPTRENSRFESPLSRGNRTEADRFLRQAWSGDQEYRGNEELDEGVAAAAYYNPSDRRITILSLGGSTWVDGDALAAHELTHALQHQRDPMSLALNWSSTERILIQMCMIEGESQVAALMLRLSRRGGSIRDVDFAAADFAARIGVGGFGPRVPYESGFRFMGRQAQRIGVERLREVYAKRPPSTEQILHPRKLGRDLPTRIQFPKLPAATLRKADTLGELGMREHFRATDGLLKSICGGIGWDGDRLEVCETDAGKWYAVWMSVWDREVDAVQAQRLLRRAGDERARLARSGRTLSWVYAPDPNLRAQVLRAVSGWDCSGAVDPEAAKTTAEIEAETVARYTAAHRVRDGRWHLPEVGVSIPVPKGWHLFVDASGAQLLSNDGRGDGVMVDSWPLAAFGDLEGVSDFVGRVASELLWTRVTQVARIKRPGFSALRVRRRIRMGGRALPGELIELYVPVDGTLVRFTAWIEAGKQAGDQRRKILRAYNDVRVGAIDER